MPGLELNFELLSPMHHFLLFVLLLLTMLIIHTPPLMSTLLEKPSLGKCNRWSTIGKGAFKVQVGHLCWKKVTGMHLIFAGTGKPGSSKPWRNFRGNCLSVVLVAWNGNRYSDYLFKKLKNC